MSTPSQKEIVISPSIIEIESRLGGNETPDVLITETQSFVNKGEYASKLVYQRSSLVIDTARKQVLVTLRATDEPQGPRLVSGSSVLISNIRNKVAGVDWDKQPPWTPLAHILKKNEEGGGYLFGIEIINGAGILDDMTSKSADTVRPATIKEALAVLEKEKPLEYKLLRSLEGMEFGNTNLVD